MLMVVDIGNTNIVVGVFHADELVCNWRLNSDTRRTDDEYGSVIRTLFRDSSVSLSAIDTAIISSVVPVLTETFASVVHKLTGQDSLILGPDVYFRLPVRVPESAVHEVGTDLLCDAVAAWKRYQGACIVCDFGTALTFTVVGSDADIRGVAIAPGLQTAVKALFRDTAQLPSVPLAIPPSSLGTNTIHAIQSGVVLGYQGLVESLIGRLRTDLGIHAPVIATGGLSGVLGPVTGLFDAIDPVLTLTGLRLIAGYLTEK